MMRTSGPGVYVREDEDASHQYGSSSSSRYVIFLRLFCFLAQLVLNWIAKPNKLIITCDFNSLDD